jgi:hypothetical protein
MVGRVGGAGFVFQASGGLEKMIGKGGGRRSWKEMGFRVRFFFVFFFWCFKIAPLLFFCVEDQYL